jgi:transcriptional antiterminator NusG
MKPPSRFVRGDQVKIVDGTFNGHKGRVVDVNIKHGLVRVELIQFERPVPVDLESWQVEKVQTV